ncbi:MAG: hypothetical protein ACLFQJ_06480 [Campylobacterales bacterium]
MDTNTATTILFFSNKLWVLESKKVRNIQDELFFVNDREFYVKKREDNLVKHREYKLNPQEYQKRLSNLSSIKKAKALLSKKARLSVISHHITKRTL